MTPADDSRPPDAGRSRADPRLPLGDGLVPDDEVEEPSAGDTDMTRTMAQRTITDELPIAGTGSDWAPALGDPVIKAYVMEAAGELGMMLAELIRDNQPILGVDITELVDEKASTVRKALYKLESARIAEYEKDTDKSGWETFTWRLTLNEVKYLINNERKEALAHLQKRLEFEANTEWYACEDDHPRVDFEAAMECGFHCPVCEAAMVNVDNSDNVERLVRQIHELESVVF